jgi:hypothetical protein
MMNWIVSYMGQPKLPCTSSIVGVKLYLKAPELPSDGMVIRQANHVPKVYTQWWLNLKETVSPSAFYRRLSLCYDPSHNYYRNSPHV